MYISNKTDFIFFYFFIRNEKRKQQQQQQQKLLWYLILFFETNASILYKETNLNSHWVFKVSIRDFLWNFD